MVMFPWNATCQEATESLSTIPYHSRERKTCHGQDYDVIPHSQKLETVQMPVIRKMKRHIVTVSYRGYYVAI